MLCSRLCSLGLNLLRWKYPHCIARWGRAQNGSVILVLCIVLASAAHGQEGLSRQEWSKRIFEADRDDNKQISYAEARAYFEDLDAEVFEWLDRNRSGLIDRRDFVTPPANSRLGLYRNSLRKALESDTNGDGLVTFRELIATKPGYPRENFDRLDADANGYLSRADLKALKDAVEQTGAEMQKADPQAIRRRRLIRRMIEADANGDGRTSFEEAIEELPRLNRRIFRRLDGNEDGFITEADLRRS